MEPSDLPSLSLRPFPVADRKPQNLSEFVSRVNAEPGGFRAISEEQLREEIRTNVENGGLDDDAHMSDGESPSADDGAEDEASLKDPAQARMEVLRQVDIAANTALLTLDFLSLLLSKQNPTQVGQTLSQHLRDMVGIGTIGADKLHEPLVTAAKVKDNEEVATGWTLMEINKIRDSAEEASRFLQKEADVEGRYWEDVVAVKKAGWSVCKVPQERQTLGVRFGFSESAPDFRNNGLAPMRRGDTGPVQLDIGHLGGVSERLLVVYEKDGQVISRSPLPAQTPDDAPLEARVLEARNTIFSQELWHELNREARTLVAYDVRKQDSRLVCDLDPTSKIILELVPLESTPSMSSDGLDTGIAEAISIALHVLLTYSHRLNELARTRPIPPYIPRSRGQQISALLRPIIAHMMHLRNVRSAATYMGALVQALQRAGLPSSLVLKKSPISSLRPTPGGPNHSASSQTMIRNMLQPVEFVLKLTLLPDIGVDILGRTSLFPVTATTYIVSLPPNSPLETICAPFKDGYPDLQSLVDYIRTATARALTEHFLSISVSGTAIRDLDQEDFELSFSVEEQEDKPAIVLACTVADNSARSVKNRTWTANQQGEAEPIKNVVGQIVGQKLL
ncbi:subunit 17 of mediator complex-domain-containing protein [Stachybotrys elegans]|uniref:Mediator of RNA polymerase II transcription subunit 17 n=1 Tax=Stachybotrys elegans TaxID=80388 RepID=A0A8K0SPV0_9HYPO|nr:subunit 17 of mediator complex-domain-containing protein [Stachybotrys elegans]